MHFLVVIWNQASIDYYVHRGALDLSSEEGWHLFRFNREELMDMAKEEWKMIHFNLSQLVLQHMNVTWVEQQFDFECCTIQQVIKLLSRSFTLKQIRQIQSAYFIQINILMTSSWADDPKEQINQDSLKKITL